MKARAAQIIWCEVCGDGLSRRWNCSSEGMVADTMRISLLCFLCLWAVAVPAADTEGPFSFVEPTVRISPGSQDGSAEITLRSSVKQTTSPSLTDVELPRPLTATVSFELVNNINPQPNTWRYKVRILGLVPANASQQRYALVIYGANKQTIRYVVTNTAANFSWSISKIPEPWVASAWLPASACNEFTVTPKDSVATNVVLGASTLVEQSTKKGMSVGKLRLCKLGDTCESGQPVTLEANVPSHLQICTTEGFHGNFHGAITLASAQKPDGDTMLQSASFSSFLAKCCGVALICVGIYFAWWSKVWARARLERDQALMPAVLMRSQLAANKEILGHLRPIYRAAAAQNVGKAIQDLLDELSDSNLDHHQFLPPKFPNPNGYTVDAAGYKAFLEARNARNLLLSFLVKEGIARAEAEDNGTLTTVQQALVETAIKNIGSISTKVPQPNLDQAFQLVQPILTKLHNDLFPGPAAAPPFNPPARPASEFETLQLQIQDISKGIWLLYGVLTALSGLAVLVLNNPGFGVPLDFILAFFWGFGLPTAVGALAPGSAASALNISIAKG